MKKLYFFIAQAAILFMFYATAGAVGVIDYNNFESNLLIGNNIEINYYYGIIKAVDNLTTYRSSRQRKAYHYGKRHDYWA